MSSIKKYTKVINKVSEDKVVSEKKKSKHKNSPSLDETVNKNETNGDKQSTSISSKKEKKIVLNGSENFDIDVAERLPKAKGKLLGSNLKKKCLIQTKTNKYFHSTTNATSPSNKPEDIDKTKDVNKQKSSTKKSVSKSKKSKLRLSLDHDNGCISLSSEDSMNVVIDKKVKPVTVNDNTVAKPPMDFFQVMMDSRKKSIGMNSPGKEIMHDDDSKDLSAQREIKAKRSLTLAMWADQKGASKKKQVEELHEQHVKTILDKRAKNFKSMLLKNKSKRSKFENNSSKLKSEEVNDESDVGCSRSKQKTKKRIRDIKSEQDLDKNSLKKTKLQSPNKKSVTPKKSSPSGSNKQQLTDNFLECLSPLPLKKTGSLLSYFDKQDSSIQNDDDLVEVLIYEDVNDESQSDFFEVQEVEPKPKLSISKKSRLKHKKLKKKKKVPEELKEITNKDMDKCNTLVNIDLSDVEIVNDDEKKTELIENPVEVVESCTESSRICRPRRTVRKPVKYQQSSEDSSSDSEDMEIFSRSKPKRDKELKKRKSTKNTNKENFASKDNEIVSPIKIVNLQSPGDLQCVKSPRTISLLKRDSARNEKLAPLFRKILPKPILDQSVIEARRLFLHSGVPDSIKMQVEKVAPVSNCVALFPTVSHTQQAPSVYDEDFHTWNLPTCSDYNNAADSEEEILDEKKECFFKSFTDLSSDTKNSEHQYEVFHNLKIYSYKDGLKKMKDDNPSFPVNRTFKQLWEKFKNQKFSATDSEEFSQSGTSGDSKHTNSSLWTEKYKPTASHDVLGNFRSVKSLKKWLEAWKEYNEISGNTCLKRPRRNSDSSSDFYASDSGSKDSTRIPTNMMVITGPPGSGKTSSVYAITNELGINVLEVNASSKRTGRKILTELQEATQSHKVLTKTNSESSMNGVLNFSGKITEKCNSQNSFKSSNDVSSQKNSDTNIMSLMLIDDADIVFEEDDGFVGALAQLVQSSKRPVVIVASDSSCNHLQRFMIDVNVISFNLLSASIVGPWLDVLVLIESNKIIPGLCADLLELNKGDVRRTMLQLQYWILGSQKNIASSIYEDQRICPSPPSEWLDEDSNLSTDTFEMKKSANEKQNVDDNNTSTQKSLKRLLLQQLTHTCSSKNYLLYNSNLFYSDEESTDSKSKDPVIDNSDLKSNLNSAFEVFDSLSCVDMMQSKSKMNSNTVKLPWTTELKDGLSESENFSMFSRYDRMSSAWCEYMTDYSFHKVKKSFNMDKDQIDLAVSNALDSRQNCNGSSSHVQFSEAIPSGVQLDRTSWTLDYMPTLRNICRSERDRSKSNFKRNNRFFHYLSSLKVDGKDNVYDSACGILDFGSS